ncbi:MAG: hypothetical protein HC851_12015 [Acaryochloris sp. RU_4_1]|nr:hypothetical protein [Acaryochloris sp. RU_4_1]NJR56837.1 hypothetical protein [Acaryochloris sp. CRU_2_0]
MSEYREALQHPHIAFRAPDLKQGVVKQTPLGLPSLVSGGFALTACVTIQTDGRQSTWAIRCFHRQAPDLQARYKYISDFLQGRNEEFFVNFSYEPEGIRVGNNWYPIVRMAWVEGQSLHDFIENNINNPASLQDLATQIMVLSNRFHNLKMAHGDLQHGNILVRNGKLVLIDYDGMYVPGMPYQTSNELGHIAFQHPRRDRSFFNETIDNFSIIAIYISLLSLATPKGSELWRKYHTGENLIFNRQDYKDPISSALFTEIQSNIELNNTLRQLIDKFQQICLVNLEAIPCLKDIDEEILSPKLAQSALSFWDRLKAFLAHILRLIKQDEEVFDGQFKVFSAHGIFQLVKQDGKKIAVVGKVNNIAEYREDSDLIATFINFGHLKRDSIREWQSSLEYKPFTVVIFSEGLDSLLNVKHLTSSSLRELEGRYLKITGLLEQAKYKRSCTPQIVLGNARQLTSVTEEEANRLIASSRKKLWEKLWNLC